MDTVLLAQQARKRSDVTRRALLSPLVDGQTPPPLSATTSPFGRVVPPSPLLEALPPSPVAEHYASSRIGEEEARQEELNEDGVDTQSICDDCDVEQPPPTVGKASPYSSHAPPTVRVKTPFTTPRTPRLRECTPREQQQDWTGVQLAAVALCALTAFWAFSSHNGDRGSGVSRMAYTAGRLSGGGARR